MKILYYNWGSVANTDILQTLLECGYDIVKCERAFNDYDRDELFVEEMCHIVESETCECIFSLNYIPLITQVAERMQIKYIAWIYDSPHLPLYSQYAKSDVNYFFHFDRNDYLRMKEMGISHIYHMPLAVNEERLNQQMGILTDSVKYQYDISFVGSLYQKNLYQQIVYLPDYLKGYIKAVMEVQKKLYGINIVAENIPFILEKLRKYVNLNLADGYQKAETKVYADLIAKEITFEERVQLLNLLSQSGSVTVFTGDSPELLPNVNVREPISYLTEMPEVFRTSKININISLRTIESGMPLRTLDVLGAGGFLLSNYQEELAENFVNGKEIVLFESAEDMVEKAEYYLAHETERKEIAYCGWKKVQKMFSYKGQITKIFESVLGEGHR